MFVVHLTSAEQSDRPAGASWSLGASLQTQWFAGSHLSVCLQTHSTSPRGAGNVQGVITVFNREDKILPFSWSLQLWTAPPQPPTAPWSARWFGGRFSGAPRRCNSPKEWQFDPARGRVSLLQYPLSTSNKLNLDRQTNKNLFIKIVSTYTMHTWLPHQLWGGWRGRRWVRSACWASTTAPC